jgi:spore coat protein U-like protein
MMPMRLAWVGMAAAGLIATLPVAGAEAQYPRGLMSAAPTEPGKNRTCMIDVRPVNFGNYDALSGRDVDALGQVIYVCGNLGASTTAQGAKAIRIELTAGLSNQFSPRAMAGPAGELLDYNLYLDPTHRTIWGQGAHGTDVYVDAKPPNRTPVMVPVYGRVFGLQDVAAGQYSDVVTAQIVF